MEITEITTVNMSETLVSPGCSVFKKSSNGFNHSTNILPNIVHALIPSPPKQYPHSPTHTYLILNGSIPHTQTFVRFYLLIEYPSRFGCVGFGGKRDHRLEENCEREEPGRGERQPRKRQTRRTGTCPNRKWGGGRGIPASSCCASSRCS